MAQTPFRVMTDEHVPNAVAAQLIEKGVDAVRLIDVLPAGTKDPQVLDFAHANNYTIVTLDQRMMKHINRRTDEGNEHAGVFIGINLQGTTYIGKIVSTVVLYDEAIKAGAATVEEDVYNEIIYIS